MDDLRFQEMLIRLEGKTDDEIAEIIAEEYPEILIESMVADNPKGYSEKEIAEKLGLTLGEVRLYLYSGTKKIKDGLKGL